MIQDCLQTDKTLLVINDLIITRSDGQHHFSVHMPNLTLQPGSMLAITGQSGCGKSTLLEMVGLILTPQKLTTYELMLESGQQRVDLTKPIKEQHEQYLASIRANAIGFVLQNGGLLPFLTVDENITLGCKNKGIPINEHFINDIMQRLSITHLRQKKPHQLSIGERQRVAFVRAMAHEPTLILADEPTAALDPYTSDALFQVMKDLITDIGLSVIVISHDWNLVQKYATARIHGQSQQAQESYFNYAE